MKDISGEIVDTRVELPDGWMHYQSAGRGFPVLLLHSMATSVWSWAKVITPLARKHTVYALDMMGQGDSDKPTGDYAIEDYAQSVVNFMTAMDIGRAAIVGNSIGATIAIQIAAVNPEMVDRLVLVGCPCSDTEQERKEKLAQAADRFDGNNVMLPGTLEGLKERYVHVSPQLLARVNEDRAKAGEWAWKCYVALSTFDILSTLKRVKAQTLVIYGEKDFLRGKEKVLESNIQGSKLVFIPDAGHLPQVDNPRAFLKIVQPFLNEF